MFLLIKRTKVKKLFLILVIVGFLTYVSSFTNQFVWDDDHFFYQNILTQNLFHSIDIFLSNTTAGAGVESNYYRPLTTFSFALDHAIWGWQPFGLHLTNTFFHIANGILLFLLLLKLRYNKIASFLISLLFLIHPIQTEAVTYLSSRGDVFYTFFLLLSLYLFTLGLYNKHTTLTIFQKKYSISKNVLLVISLLLFPLSILSKEGALTTVPMYAGILLVFAIQKKLSVKKVHEYYKNHILVLLLLILITIIYFILRLTVLNFTNSLNYSGDQSIYGTHLAVRLITFLKTIPIYIRLLLIPYPLYLERTTTIVTTLINPIVITSLIILLGTLTLGFLELRRQKTVWIFFALILIFSNLLSVSGVIPQTGLLRENWLYMPMIGFYMIIFTTSSIFFLHFIKKHSQIFSFILILLCSIFIIMTIQQNYNWRNRIAYFEHNLQFVDTARLHLNLGNAYIGVGNYTKALYHLQRAVKIADSYPQTHYNLAAVYLHYGRTDLAEQEYLKSLALDPNFLYTYPLLINLYEQKNEPTKALPYTQKLTKIYPSDLKIAVLYAKELYQTGNRIEAERAFKKALILSHNDPKLLKAIQQTKSSY
ncbi:MAG TPA: tetratricopeptide repeat protein [Candidatus Sulfotelmatobacter sp.]|nr:tetratricopeptide repeat protein [Candidatus Sulfotelmatobacter sp.]